jgi:23S rRNA U2552 (ribose-2'-O)-methylase RlmE/FtsJ
MDQELVDYIFEIKEELTDEFYLGIMDLLKKKYNCEISDAKIIEYLLDNVEKINTVILKNITTIILKAYQPKKSNAFLKYLYYISFMGLGVYFFTSHC